MNKFFAIAAMLFSVNTFASTPLPADGRFDIWPTIPFVRGADLCAYKDAYGQSRSEYMTQMTNSAERLLAQGASGYEALNLLVNFNSLYDKNQELAVRYNYLDVTLESTLKAYIDQLYRQFTPRTKKISFQYVNDILNIVNAAKAGMRDGYLDNALLAKLDFIAYGTYALAPNCQGDIQVTVHLIGRDGTSESFIASGKPEYVMSKIAADMFTAYQRTQFPSQIRVGDKVLTLVGGLNGSVDRVADPKIAEESCATLDARLPTDKELDLLNSYGDWSGGVSLNDQVWALAGDKVFAPTLRNPSPVREKWEVNAEEFLYYCVK